MNAGIRVRDSIRRRVSRVRSDVSEKLRWRLGFYKDLMLPPLPQAGVSTGRGARLRPYVAEDIPKYADLMASAGAELAQFASLGDDPQKWLEEVRRRAELAISPYELAIVVESESGDEFVGAFFLAKINDRESAAEMGFLLSPAALGGGIGPRMAHAVIRWLIDADLHRVETRHDVVNTIACRAASGVGMKQEGISRAAYPVDEGGETVWHDVCDHALVNPAHRRAVTAAKSGD